MPRSTERDPFALSGRHIRAGAPPRLSDGPPRRRGRRRRSCRRHGRLWHADVGTRVDEVTTATPAGQGVVGWTRTCGGGRLGRPHDTPPRRPRPRVAVDQDRTRTATRTGVRQVGRRQRSANHWRAARAELKNRKVENVFFVARDVLNGLAESVVRRSQQALEPPASTLRIHHVAVRQPALLRTSASSELNAICTAPRAEWPAGDDEPRPEVGPDRESSAERPAEPSLRRRASGVLRTAGLATAACTLRRVVRPRAPRWG